MASAQIVLEQTAKITPLFLSLRIYSYMRRTPHRQPRSLSRSLLIHLQQSHRPTRYYRDPEPDTSDSKPRLAPMTAAVCLASKGNASRTTACFAICQYRGSHHRCLPKRADSRCSPQAIPLSRPPHQAWHRALASSCTWHPVAFPLNGPSAPHMAGEIVLHSTRLRSFCNHAPEGSPSRHFRFNILLWSQTVVRQAEFAFMNRREE